MKPITLKDYLKGRDEEFPEEWTPAKEDAALDLLVRVNSLLEDLGVEFWSVSSGWRPAVINAATIGASKSSYHVTCQAIDLVDNKPQTLGLLILTHPEFLRHRGLWMKDLRGTRGKVNWVHLDTGKRHDRSIRVFKP